MELKDLNLDPAAQSLLEERLETARSRLEEQIFQLISTPTAEVVLRSLWPTVRSLMILAFLAGMEAETDKRHQLLASLRAESQRQEQILEEALAAREQIEYKGPKREPRTTES